MILRISGIEVWKIKLSTSFYKLYTEYQEHLKKGKKGIVDWSLIKDTNWLLWEIKDISKITAKSLPNICLMLKSYIRLKELDKIK